MLLKNLLPKDQNFNLLEEELNKRIENIEIDSRKVTQNSIFFALKGNATNGIKFIDKAIQNGANIIICSIDEIPKIDKNITLIKTKNPHDLLVFMLQKFYSNLPKNIFAVTGTNGKTSVAEFCRQILEILGKKAATIGTLGVNIADLKVKEKLIDNSLTTPDLVTLYKNLSILKEHKVDYVIIEASSIGLEQGRLDGIDFKVAAFTNFSQDHLDYHQNMDEYFSSKMILFKKNLAQNSLAVINCDDKKFDEIKEICSKNKLELVSYGKNQANFQIFSLKEDSNFQDISLSINGKIYDFKISLLENFQATNIICALAIISSYLKLGEEETTKLVNDLINLTCVNGRMEKIATLENNAKIYIDFAHSPDALENLLTMAKKQAKGRLIVVFGCGGDRDAKKRPLMGKITSELADIAIITDDNPRTENAAKIRKEIIAGIENKTKIGNKIIEVEKRKEAIKKAISLLKQDDILIIAGKGHEKYQIIGDKYFSFDEKEIILEFISIFKL